MESDKAIECNYMKDIKGTGGLVSGTGFETIQRNTFLFSRPACAEVTSAIESITNSNSGRSEQHKEERDSRMIKDAQDMQKINDFFYLHDPLSSQFALETL